MSRTISIDSIGRRDVCMEVSRAFFRAFILCFRILDRQRAPRNQQGQIWRGLFPRDCRQNYMFGSC